MRGFFGIGVAGASKSMNVGSLFRTAHAFGASFVFTLGGPYARRVGRNADTSDTLGQVPFYEFPDIEHLILPEGTEMVAVEILDEAEDLPSFYHPRRAAYVLGAERTHLPADVIARCQHRVKIPTRFSLNVALAGAIVLYDRAVSLGRFARRPLSPQGESMPAPAHVYGAPRFRRDAARYRAVPPLGDAAE